MCFPENRRRDYIVEVTRNCVTERFGDVNLTLLSRGEPIGFNSSKIFELPVATDAPRYTFERNTFVEKTRAGKGNGKFLETMVVKALKPRVDYLTGRVGMESAGMFRVLNNAGFRQVGGEVYLSSYDVVAGS